MFFSPAKASSGPTIWSNPPEGTLLTVDPTDWYIEPETGENVTTYYTPKDQYPSIIGTTGGKVWLAWQSEFPPENPAGKFEIFYKTYNGNWDERTQLTDNPGKTNKTPAALQTADNKIWIFWVSDKTGNFEICYKTTVDEGLSWSDETQVTNSTSKNLNPTVFQASNGTVWLIWTRELSSSITSLFLKTFNGTTWSDETMITSNNYDQLPSALQAKNGTILVFWTRNSAGDYHLFYKAYNGATWYSEQALTSGTRINIDPTAFVEKDGTIWLFWASSTKTGTFDIWYKTSTNNGGTFSSSTQFTNVKDDDKEPFATQAGSTFWVVWESNRDDPNGNPNSDLYCRFSVIGDINRDGYINNDDLYLISKAIATDSSWPHGTGWNQYNPECDLNNDNKVNVLDLALCAANWGSYA